MTNYAIYIKTKNSALLSYNRDGKMPKKIGSIGRGPGEYLYCISFAINEKKETIYIMDLNDDINVYSKNGTFLKSISLNKYGAFHFADIEFLNPNLFVFEYITIGQGKYNWIILDSLDNLVKQKKNSIQSFKSGMGANGGTYKFGNRLSYWNMYNDTIFSILPDLSYTTSILFNFGKNKIPKSNDYDKTRASYVVPSLIFESNRFLFFRYNFDKKFIISLIEKESNKSFLIYLEDYDLGGIQNDLDDGPMFLPRTYFSENGWEYMIGLLTASQLKKHISSEEFKNREPKYPEKKKELEKLANSLQETDNPVLMVVRLKK